MPHTRPLHDDVSGAGHVETPDQIEGVDPRLSSDGGLATDQRLHVVDADLDALGALHIDGEVTFMIGQPDTHVMTGVSKAILDADLQQRVRVRAVDRSQSACVFGILGLLPDTGGAGSPAGAARGGEGGVSGAHRASRNVTDSL